MFGQDSFNWVPTQPKINHRLVKQANQTELVKDWDTVSMSLKEIQAECPNVGGADEELCTSGPFAEFTIRGTGGTAKNDGRWWWVTDNELGLSDYGGDSDEKSGACSIVIRDGYQVKLKFSFETNSAGIGFQNDWNSASFDPTWEGVIDKTTTSTTVLMKGGDKLSVDIDGDWAGIANFFLSVQGATCHHDSTNFLSDECFIELLEVYTDGSSDNGGNGCSADNNKVLSDDGDCSCMPGYTIDENDATGPCVKDNTMLYVGIGGAILVGLLLLGK